MTACMSTTAWALQLHRWVFPSGSSSSEIPDEPVITLINPEIVKKTGERDVSEGCLSIPGYRGDIKRAETVLAKGQGLDGKEVRIKATDLLAQALEHEVGHIQGSLYTDLLESMDNLHKLPPEEGEE